MSQFGSLQNHLYSRMTIGEPAPTVGLGATILLHSDRKAGTIIRVRPVGKSPVVYVQRDSATRTDTNGMSEDQTYDYERDPSGPIYMFRKDRQGRWQEVTFNEATGRFSYTEGAGLRLGERREYYDFTR